jgi:hypothetical protein
VRDLRQGRQDRQKILSRTVCCDEGGVSQTECFVDREVQTRVVWAEVTAVFAYKQDCFAVDRIWIAIADQHDRVRVELNEDDVGYQALIDELPKRLPGCPSPDEWFTRVAIPAFETNLTVLFRRT